MFSPGERAAVRDRLVARARSDDRITAAALVGSAARDAEDAWSDIDLALRVADAIAAADVVADWTAAMYADFGAAADLDVWSGGTLFRVFLLQNTLQVDLSFWPADRFAAAGGPFRLLFGSANAPAPAATTSPARAVGMGWLYAVHARSSIARGRVLQAVTMLDGLREQVISLACLRHGLPADQGRGVDDLPEPVRAAITSAIAVRPELGELRRAFAMGVRLLLDEARAVDPAVADRIAAPLQELSDAQSSRS